MESYRVSGLAGSFTSSSSSSSSSSSFRWLSGLTARSKKISTFTYDHRTVHDLSRDEAEEQWRWSSVVVGWSSSLNSLSVTPEKVKHVRMFQNGGVTRNITRRCVPVPARLGFISALLRFLRRFVHDVQNKTVAE
ncbi:hypothetical protein O3P69_017034 [Scylla paramamosain]|uniref:Uncharacterized protein n=1 Tax=Scylla paramamosain TaxID=85552 RepID=A0AAW0TVE6_SCYPA